MFEKNIADQFGFVEIGRAGGRPFFRRKRKSIAKKFRGQRFEIFPAQPQTFGQSAGLGRGDGDHAGEYVSIEIRVGVDTGCERRGSCQTSIDVRRINRFMSGETDWRLGDSTIWDHAYVHGTIQSARAGLPLEKAGAA